MSNSLQSCGLQPARVLCLWNSLGKNTRVGSHSLLQVIFPTHGQNLGLLCCKQILYHLSHLMCRLNTSSVISMLGLLWDRSHNSAMCQVLQLEVWGGRQWQQLGGQVILGGLNQLGGQDILGGLEQLSGEGILVGLSQWLFTNCPCANNIGLAKKFIEVFL